MNSLKDDQSGRTPNTPTKKYCKRQYKQCVICDDKKNSQHRIVTSVCGCRFHESCIIDFRNRQESNNIFTRSCFNGCSLAVHLDKENTESDAANNEYDMDQTNSSGAQVACSHEAPVLTACRTGNLELLQCEYNKSPRIIRDKFKSMVDGKYYSLIFMAIKESQLAIVKFLTTDKNSTINCPPGTDSALHVAVQNGHLEIVKHLILSGGNLSLINSENKTALEIAIDNHHQAIIKELIKNTTPGNVDEVNMMYDFVKEKNSVSIEHFNFSAPTGTSIAPTGISIAPAGTSIAAPTGTSIAPSFNYPNDFNVSFLMAIKKNDISMIEDLIANEVNVNSIDDASGMTFLSYAIKHQCWVIVKYLIEKNADVNLIDRDTGRTPLHNAIDTRNTDMILHLIKRGANIDEGMDNDGHTPLSYAIATGDMSIIEPLTEICQTYESIKEDIITDLIDLKKICEENDQEYSHKEPNLDINKFENAIKLIKPIGPMKITKSNIGSDGCDPYEATDGSSRSWYDVNYKNKKLYTILEDVGDMRFCSKYTNGSYASIETSDLFTELVCALEAPLSIETKSKFDVYETETSQVG